MPEYIERTEALEITTRTCGDYAAAWSEIRKLPAADVAPVVHGWWIGSGDGYANGELVYDMWECSECGYDADGADEEPNWNYCPNCGAKMRQEPT